MAEHKCCRLARVLDGGVLGAGVGRPGEGVVVGQPIFLGDPQILLDPCMGGQWVEVPVNVVHDLVLQREDLVKPAGAV